jgi:hypothetical protein
VSIRSARQFRATHPPRHPPVNPFQQHRDLGRGQRDAANVGRWPQKMARLHDANQPRLHRSAPRGVGATLTPQLMFVFRSGAPQLSAPVRYRPVRAFKQATRGSTGWDRVSAYDGCPSRRIANQGNTDALSASLRRAGRHSRSFEWRCNDRQPGRGEHEIGRVASFKPGKSRRSHPISAHRAAASPNGETHRSKSR